MKKFPHPWHALRRTVLAAALVGAATAYANNADITSLLQSSQPEQALKLIDQRLAAAPKDPQLRFLQGVAQAMANKNKEAIDTFTQLTEEFPELPEPYNNLAVLYANQNQLDKSRQALEQAIRTSPSYSTAHANLGDIYAKLASQAYSKALQLDGNHADSVKPKLALIHDLFSTGQSKAQALAQAPNTAPPAAPAAQAPAVTSSPTAPAPTATVVAAAPPPAPMAAAQPVAPAVVAEAPTAPPASPPAAAPTAEVKTTAKTEPKAEPPTESSPPSAAHTAPIEAAVHTWAKAWAAKDMAGYLAAYSPNFQTPGKQSRKAWEAERRARIVGKRSISVNLADLTVTAEQDRATARFRQHYRADALNISSRKVLQLELRNGQWLITRETTGN